MAGMNILKELRDFAGKNPTADPADNVHLQAALEIESLRVALQKTQWAMLDAAQEIGYTLKD